MTPENSNLLQQLADLRVEPPENGFSARLRLELDQEAARMGALGKAQTGEGAGLELEQAPEQKSQAGRLAEGGNVISLGERRANKSAPLRLKKPLLWLAVAMVLVSGGAAAWVGPARIVGLFRAAPAEEVLEPMAPEQADIQPAQRARTAPARKPPVIQAQPELESPPLEPAAGAAQLQLDPPKHSAPPNRSLGPQTTMQQRLNPRPQVQAPTPLNREGALQQLSLPQREDATRRNATLARRPAPKQLKLKLDRIKSGSQAQQHGRPAAKLKQQLKARKRAPRELNGSLKQRTRPNQARTQTLRQRVQEQRQRGRERRSR